ncbi:hypothetical protein AX14_006847 [Amanita brunnescens Koide BX004]|jgi:hypothetical protein|nr:hypothetical protein AX14_006847 [Amanita brunnescens Koide BX004]
MNTIIIHRSIPRPYTSRDEYMEVLYEAVDVVLMPIWSSIFKPTPWWVGEGESSQKLETIPEEVVDAVAGVDGDTTDVEDDDVTVVDPGEHEEDSGEFPLGEIDVDKQFDWAERLVLEEDLEQEDDDEEDWVIDAYASGWRSIVHEEEEDLSIYSQDSFVKEGDDRSVRSQVECDPEESQQPTRLSGEILAKVVKFMTKSAHMARGRRTRRAL